MCEVETDRLGPLKVLRLHSEKAGLDAVVVVDNVALGPAIGGVRVSRTVTAQEVQRLARTMTLKNSIAGLAHGGGKAGIMADPRSAGKEQYFRIFARLIKELYEYIPGPDMGSNEECMVWIQEETGRAVGLPGEIGGLPLDRLGATGFGLAECAAVACNYAGIALSGARIAIEGFGSVGRAAAEFLFKKGALIVAASDTGGTVYNPGGLDVPGLLRTKKDSGSVLHYADAKRLGLGDIFALDCDILIPAAAADVINENNAGQIRARMILEGANIPVTKAADEILMQKGVLIIPDFIANSGGVIMAAMEYARKAEKEAFETISEKIRWNTDLILRKVFTDRNLKLSPRAAAVEIARERVLEAQKYREY